MKERPKKVSTSMLKAKLKARKIIAIASNTSFTKLGIFVFSYTLFVGLFIQFIALPLIVPDLHAGDGLIINLDSVNFHNQAVDISEKISAGGWSEWELRPKGYAPVGIASFFYTIIEPKPWVLLPLNALLKSLSVIGLAGIIYKITNKRWVAIFSVIPLIFFPSSLQWDSQIHNDSVTIAGVFLYLDGLIGLLFSKANSASNSEKRYVTQIAAGLLLTFIVRPYYTLFLMPISIIATIIFIISITRNGSSRKSAKRVLAFLFLAIAFQFYLGIQQSTVRISETTKEQEKISVETTIEKDSGPSGLELEPELIVNYTDKITTIFNEITYPIRKVRTGFISNPAPATNIDNHIAFNSALDIVSYIPRAVQIGLFSPFPNMWFERGAKAISPVLRVVSGIEMLVAYFAYWFLAQSLWFWRTRKSFLLVVFAAAYPIIMMSLVIVNIGTLYRFRYPFTMLLVSIGIAYLLESKETSFSP